MRDAPSSETVTSDNCGHTKIHDGQLVGPRGQLVLDAGGRKDRLGRRRHRLVQAATVLLDQPTIMPCCVGAAGKFLVQPGSK